MRFNPEKLRGDLAALGIEFRDLLNEHARAIKVVGECYRESSDAGEIDRLKTVARIAGAVSVAIVDAGVMGAFDTHVAHAASGNLPVSGTMLGLNVELSQCVSNGVYDRNNPDPNGGIPFQEAYKPDAKIPGELGYIYKLDPDNPGLAGNIANIAGYYRGSPDCRGITLFYRIQTQPTSKSK